MNNLNRTIDRALLILRISSGALFIIHGLQEAFGLFGGPGIRGFSAYLSSMGFPQALLSAHISAYLKIVAGACIITGLFTKRSLLLFLILILAAVVRVHWAKGYFLLAGDEYKLILYSVLIVLMILGPGKLSAINKSKKSV